MRILAADTFPSSGLAAVARRNGNPRFPAVLLGYFTPILGVAGLGLVFHELLPKERSLLLDVVPVVVLALAVGVVFWKLNEEDPYRDIARSSQTKDLGEISPKLAGIRTNPSTFGRYLELKALVQTHSVDAQRPFAVLQDYPGARFPAPIPPDVRARR